LVPPGELCTDNGAMVAWAGAERLAHGLRDPLDTPPHPRWPLAEVSKPAADAVAADAAAASEPVPPLPAPEAPPPG
jgi:N6-L-threonylcarbamoyladenine synthase